MCAEGLAHPHSGEIRPIVFDHNLARGRDDVVLVHLNHRLVQMAMRLLRAEVWGGDRRGWRRLFHGHDDTAAQRATATGRNEHARGACATSTMPTGRDKPHPLTRPGAGEREQEPMAVQVRRDSSAPLALGRRMTGCPVEPSPRPLPQAGEGEAGEGLWHT